MTAPAINGRSVSTADAHIEDLLWRTALGVFAIASLAVLASLSRTLGEMLSTDEWSPMHRVLVEFAYYKGFWALVCLAACTLAVLRRFPAVVIGLGCLLVIEFMALSLHEYVTTQPFKQPAIGPDEFMPHPLLQGIPRPGQYGIKVHTEDHLRRTINEGKSPDAHLIALVGGSTTYDEGVDDDAETWASVLSQLLGPNFVVENHGVPGYSSVEHILQTLFEFRTRTPKCAVYYVGWNDLRSSNLSNLKPDYTNFHLLVQKDTLALTAAAPLLVRMSAFASILHNIGNVPLDVPGETRHEYDRNLSAIYKENIALIDLIARHYGIKPIFIPQVLNYEQLKGTSSYGWLPFIQDGDVKPLMAMMNADLAAVAEKSKAPYFGEVLQVPWEDSDFVDNGHFAPQGSRKFAEKIASHIAAECR